MKRCVINVGVNSWYPWGTERLRRTLKEHSPGIDFVGWRGCYPPGPTHQEAPFAFKSTALAEVIKMGYESIIWADCSCWVVRPVEPMFDHLEEVGHIFLDDGWKLGQWSSDWCLAHYGLTRNEAMDLQATTAMCWGVTVHGAFEWIRDFIVDCQKPELIHGSLRNLPGQRMIDPHSGYDCGVISADPRCRGHAREQTIMGHLAHRYGKAYTKPPMWRDTKPPNHQPDPRAVFQACGM